MAPPRGWLPLAAVLLALLCRAEAAVRELKVGYYAETCPQAEDIVRATMARARAREARSVASVMRLQFHDCFVNGCDGSVLMDATPTMRGEKDALSNIDSLRSFDVVDEIKEALEERCPGVVSCADIIAFAARDASFFLSGGRINFDMLAGRLDGRISLDSHALNFLPPPTFGLPQLIGSFATKGLGVEDMVVLSGAHTVGLSHCSSFVPDRLAVPSDMDPTLAASLRQQCPANPSPSNDPTVVQDIVTPITLDNQYYKNVLAKKVLFTSDDALVTSPATAKMVQDNANIPGWWEDRFKAAMVKMASVEVKTGSGGEIRRNCRAVNY